jgi:hypothetical protein
MVNHARIKNTTNWAMSVAFRFTLEPFSCVGQTTGVHRPVGRATPEQKLSFDQGISP